MRRILFVAAAALALPGLAEAAKKKSKEPPPPPLGDVKVGDWICYAPPDFGKMSASERKTARSKGYLAVEPLVKGEALDAKGNKREDFKLAEEDLEYFESAFLGRPERIDAFLAENWQRCKAVGEGKATKDAYRSWLAGIGRELEQNECYSPLIYEIHDFLDIASGWQWRFHMCKGDSILIESTGVENGKYTVSDTGKFENNIYITAEGDPAVPEAGEKGLVPEAPLGALMMKFEAEDGSYTKYEKVGAKVEFQAPDHGYISFAVNDVTYFDNKFHDLKGAIDYLGVDIYPAETPDKAGY